MTDASKPARAILSLDARGADRGASRGADRGAQRGADRGAERGATRPASGAPCLPGYARKHGASPQTPAARPPARTKRGADHGARHAVPHGALHGAARVSRPAPAAEPMDAQTVLYRLEEAGRTLLALPNTGYTTKLRTSAIEMLRNALDGGDGGSAAPGETKLRPPTPSAARITRMDEAFAWVVLIPRERYVIRRIVGCRALVSPTTERHLFSWRRIATLLGADHRAIQRWHAQGIDMIVAAVNATR